MWKLELLLNVDTFELGVLISKLELEPNVITFGPGVLMLTKRPPAGLEMGIGQVRLGYVRLALSTLIPFIFLST